MKDVKVKRKCGNYWCSKKNGGRPLSIQWTLTKMSLYEMIFETHKTILNYFLLVLTIDIDCPTYHKTQINIKFLSKANLINNFPNPYLQPWNTQPY